MMFLDTEPLVADNNRRIYNVNIEKLIRSKKIRIYEGQRDVIHSRVIELAKYFNQESHNVIKVRGNLLVCEWNGDYFLIDGQHRYRALEHLLELGVKMLSISNVTIEVIPVTNEDALFAEFRNINLSVPVPTHKIWVNKTINESVELLGIVFPKAFKKKRVSPALKIDSFKDTLITADVIRKLKIDNVADLTHSIIMLNDSYRGKGLQHFINVIARTNKAEIRRVTNGFAKCETGEYLFLGLFSNDDWIKDLLEQ